MLYITRHGESNYNVIERIGGDSDLTAAGREYAKQLASHFGPLPVWCSSLQRAISTASEFSTFTICEQLDEIKAGICEHLTYKEIQTAYPAVHAERIADKFNFRYPNGESYADVYRRVSTLCIKGPALIICHQAVARMLLAYLLQQDPVTFVTRDIPLGSVFCVDTKKKEMFCLSIKI
jgi:broad specificity phosphatase PhoE